MKDTINVMLMTTATTLFVLFSDASLAAQDFDEDYYNECLLKNVKPGVDRSASGLIAQACKHKATPKKCRVLSDAPLDLLDPFAPPSGRSKCVDACKTENYYSRTFGDCSTG